MTSFSDTSSELAVVLKLRPSRHAPGHISDKLWNSILSLSGFSGFRESPKRLRYLYDGSTYIEEYVELIKESILSVNRSSTLIVDACIDVNNPQLRYCLKSLELALQQLVNEGRLSCGTVLVVTSNRDKESFSLYDDVMEGSLAGWVWILSGDRSVTGEQPPDRVSKIFSRLESLVDPDGVWVAYAHFEANLLRQRGVFIDRAKVGRFYAYRYILDESGFRYVHKLIDRLLERLNREVKYILVDVSSSYWMRNLAKGLSGRELSSEVVIVDGTVTDEIKAGVAEAGENVMLLCGVTYGGGSANRIYKHLELEPSSKHIKVALLCRDLDRNAQDVPTDVDNNVWKIRAFSGGDWYILRSVDIRVLSSDSWQVKVANYLEEIQDLADPPKSNHQSGRFEDVNAVGDRRKVQGINSPLMTEVGMWDLVAALGVGKERIAGTGAVWGRRPGVRYIPGGMKSGAEDCADYGGGSLYGDLDEFDANWLAETMLLAFLDCLKAEDRNQLVIISPKLDHCEGVGASRVLNAMIHYRGVKAIEIDRDDIRSKGSLRGYNLRCADVWSSCQFVIFDEAAVTREMLRAVQNYMVRSSFPARMAGVVFDVGILPHQSMPIPILSLAYWNHISEV